MPKESVMLRNLREDRPATKDSELNAWTLDLLNYLYSLERILISRGLMIVPEWSLVYCTSKGYYYWNRKDGDSVIFNVTRENKPPLGDGGYPVLDYLLKVKKDSPLNAIPIEEMQ